MNTIIKKKSWMTNRTSYYTNNGKIINFNFYIEKTFFQNKILI